MNISSKEYIAKVMELSGNIIDLANEQHNGEGMPNGDYQGAIEAQIMIAIRYGYETAKGETPCKN